MLRYFIISPGSPKSVMYLLICRCLFSLVNLSFVSLICRVPASEPKWVEEKEKFLPLHKSKSVFPSGHQIIIIKLGWGQGWWGQGWYNQRIYSEVSKVAIVFCFSFCVYILYSEQ